MRAYGPRNHIKSNTTQVKWELLYVSCNIYVLNKSAREKQTERPKRWTSVPEANVIKNIPFQVKVENMLW